MTAETVMEPVHPGEVLLQEFLKPLSLSRYHLPKELNVLARRINEIVHGERRITADTALRLARFFGTSERFWMNLQARYDLEIERDRLGPTLDAVTCANLLVVGMVVVGRLGLEPRTHGLKVRCSTIELTPRMI